MFGCSSTEVNNSKESSISKKEDEFSGVTFYSNEKLKNSMMYGVPWLKVYGVENDGIKISRIVIRTYNHSVMGMNSAIIINENKDRASFKFNFAMDVDTDIANGYVNEQADIVLTKEDALTLYKVLSGEKVKMRASGKFNKIHKIPNTHVEGIKEMIVFLYPDEF